MEVHCNVLIVEMVNGSNLFFKSHNLSQFTCAMDSMVVVVDNVKASTGVSLVREGWDGDDDTGEGDKVGKTHTMDFNLNHIIEPEL
ncbi:hypothetical protein RIF29_20002 [Crotalaria pallida]|uniref:Uncharacterized protein n=1 Tax=Crotalaria pallida TaxID=3830 RepID=A0AAN9F8T6_CROPI